MWSRYDELQSSQSTVDCPAASCLAMPSGGPAGGTEPGSMAPPAPRVSPRPRAKDEGTPRPETHAEPPLTQQKSFNSRRGRGREDGGQEQIWEPAKDRVGRFPPQQTWVPDRGREEEGAEQAWVVAQAQGPEQHWVADGGPGEDQAGRADTGPAGGQGSSGSKRVWGSVQTQDQTWSETSRDGEHIWRPGGFLSIK